MARAKALQNVVVMGGLLLGVVAGRAQNAVNASTLVGKTLVGYQGWFRCPGDGSPGHGWSHWSRGAVPTPESMVVDLFPDTSELNAVSKCALPGETVGGGPAYVFSSFPKETAEKHFEWMREYGIDGALVQRFLTDIPQDRSEGDAVLKNVAAAAEANGRVFAVEYDLTAVMTVEGVQKAETDWEYLQGLKLTASPAYLRQAGKPVVSLWGLGFNDKTHLNDPQALLALVEWFQTEGHATVVGGVPAGWRTLSGDCRKDPAWRAVFAKLDVVQPWTVDRFKTPKAAAKWGSDHFAPDVAAAEQGKQLYLPVIFPGFSWHNLSHGSKKNEIPRLGGEFLMAQANAAKSAGAVMVKIAMFDEVNEGTAIFKAAPTKADAPTQSYWLTLDADGRQLSSDWYLKLAGKVAAEFRVTD